MKTTKSLAVIGSSGMLGWDLVEFLKSKFKVTGIDRKNYNQNKGRSFDIVVNANGNSNKFWAKDHIFEDFEASTVSVYKSLFDFPCQVHTYISSADVYENHSGKRFTSESQAIKVEKLSGYGLHKYLSECIVKNFSKNYIILRCPMVLGSKLRKGPIYDILNSSRLYVSAESSFQMVTTQEIANIISFLINKNIKSETFNIGGQGTISLGELSKYFKKKINFPKNGKVARYELDVTKLNKKFKTKTSEEYLQDFLKQL